MPTEPVNDRARAGAAVRVVELLAEHAERGYLERFAQEELAQCAERAGCATGAWTVIRRHEKLRQELVLSERRRRAYQRQAAELAASPSPSLFDK